MNKKFVLFKIMSIFLVFVILFSFNTSSVYAKENSGKNNDPRKNIDYEEVNEGISELRQEISFYSGMFSAFVLLTSVLILTIHFVRLATSYNHPLHRRKIMEDIATVLVTTALLGGVGIIVYVVAGFAF